MSQHVWSFGKEICNALIDDGINVLKLPSIVANVDSRNKASVKILDGSKLQVAVGENNSNCSCDLVYRWRRAVLFARQPAGSSVSA